VGCVVVVKAPAVERGVSQTLEDEMAWLFRDRLLQLL
jgi:hypothetical protein